MWRFSTSTKAETVGKWNGCPKPAQSNLDCSDDEVSSCSGGEEWLECPICWESFNVVENVPYVLWCGHTLCKNCVLGLQWAVVKLPTLPVQLPFFISCPWCNLLSFRLIYKGELKFPCKNYFLLWMIESMNGERENSHSSFGGGRQSVWTTNISNASGSATDHRHIFRRAPGHNHTEIARRNSDNARGVTEYLNVERIYCSLRKSLVFFVHMTAKFPLVIIFLIIVIYAIPASAAILALYILVTILFALPSFLMLYFAYPSLDWLIREILN
ncbi:hypothetical protein J5N97_028594 [Dioscorea zingiberensis]|uniref:RING-type domain-containing protein n=1 Tax=Dioscorea zingiberensis TaxID=325984 RepID=A0A9D5BYR2_9LILI|nr:hypothetical protein J5N97_028594 [Dioscorea zingiberensis]